MKKFVTKFIIAIVIVYSLAWGLDYIICKGLLKMEDYRFQDYAAMLEGGMDNDVLIMGNSRGKSHFDPAIIDSKCGVESFCIGIGGYPINAQLAKFHIYCSKNCKPKYVIQSCDYMTINLFNDVRHQHQSEQFFPLIYDKTARQEMSKLGYGFLELNCPLYRMFGYQMAIKNGLLEGLGLKHYVSMPAYKGHRPEEGSWDGSELEIMEKHAVEMPDKAKQLFEDYLAECRKDSIEVILVNSPMYEGAFEKITNRDEIDDFFKSMATKFDLTYLDYTHDCDISCDTANFCVSVHMNPEATKRFTEELCADLDSLGIF